MPQSFVSYNVQLDRGARALALFVIRKNLRKFALMHVFIIGAWPIVVRVSLYREREVWEN